MLPPQEGSVFPSNSLQPANNAWHLEAIPTPCSLVRVLYLDKLLPRDGSEGSWKKRIRSICLRLPALVTCSLLLRETRTKNQGNMIGQGSLWGPDNGKGQGLDIHVMLSQRGAIWAADVTATYQVCFWPCYQPVSADE